MIKKIIDWIIEQEKESIDDYPKLVQPLAEKFDLKPEISESIINTIIGWESDTCPPSSLENVLTMKFAHIL